MNQPTSGANPLAEYQTRLERYRQEVLRLGVRDRLLSHARLTVVVLGLALAWMAFSRYWLSPWWLLVPGAIFVALLALHDRTSRRRRLCQRAMEVYERGISRIEDRWSSAEPSGVAYVGESHPYDMDLDLFGPASLFQLLSTARTRGGEETLARWLSQPASPAVVRARQEAVEELRFRLDFREDLAIMGEDVQEGVHPDRVMEWGAARPVFRSNTLRLISLALVGATAAAFGAWLILDVTPLPLMLLILVEVAFGLTLRKKVMKVIGRVEEPRRSLDLIAVMLSRIEREPFSSPRLVELKALLQTEGLAPSRQIARLARLVDYLETRNNQFFRPFSYLLLWTTQVAVAIESWRRECGRAMGIWLDALGEMEALCSLASYAYEHPHDPFPEIAEEGVCYMGEDLGHPLLTEARCVRNSVRLDDDLRLLVVSGSNMSGKSTLLRTVGVSVVMALAGAPVRASSLRLSFLTLGATIRVQDSLQAGISRFYAEISRIRRIMDLTRDAQPVLFLLDEILHGTNSHDRSIGAKAVVKGLVEQGAIGLVTTHDLALTQIAESPALKAKNVHFQDRLEEGKMIFDYRIHEGVVRKSNALELMRAMGLEV